MKPPVFGIADAFQFDQPAYAIDVALDDVTAETTVGLHGKLEVDERALVYARERGALPGFGGEVGTKGSCLNVERGQANAADGNTVAATQLRGSILRSDSDAAIFTALRDFCDLAYFFDDSGKHVCLQL